MLRANAGEDQVVNEVDWWTHFLNSNKSYREDLLSQRSVLNKNENISVNLKQ